MCAIILELTICDLSRDFQQCGILSSVDEPVYPPFKLRNSK